MADEPEQDAPLTKEEFTAQLQRLTERAKAAGLHPIRTMAHTYAKQGMSIGRGILAAIMDGLEGDDGSKKKT